jgi:DNA-directed RNA polymerase specialized sigma24 family protein
MSVEEAATHLNVSPRTVKRHWMLARAWLNKELNRELNREPGAHTSV